MKAINIALISLFLLSACTTQTTLPQAENTGEFLGVETEEMPIEKEPAEAEKVETDELDAEIIENNPEPIKPASPVIEEPTPQPQKTYVAPTPKPAGKPEPTPAPQQNCHPSYSGCLKADASDYDCAGGSGNGPYYTNKVRVLGPDVFDLDRDHDGWGCE